MATSTVTPRPAKKSPVKKNNIKRASHAKQKPSATDSEEILWQQLYVISEHWQSDLVFFYDELNFLKKLIDKYFIWLIDDDNIASTRKLASDLSKFEENRFSILQSVDHHRKSLRNLMENPFFHNAQECKDKHEETGVLFADLVKAFRKLKRQVFNLTETVIDSERTRHLLNGLPSID